ncbi:hypothetical protein [Actinobacillus equuli]|uniref:RNA helicase n=1 Tax=Actinobacillus equuli TaxID=718 RepID=A0AAX3FKN4_ACTEU|nr:hypothetical protein [Actinobacillus equuli]AIZ80348.1 hypothetical protein ACEE_11450 [Actinobacillus equuli subsp. equuli]WGE44452.1 hypothetical protein NYR65_11325 [Actinobacillus equuli subsp. equuli]VEE91794.1 Uncharacterised protein [Actinobacillus equuli]
MAKSDKIDSQVENTTDSGKEKIQCGLIMPISSIDGCSSDHWIEIKSIISDAIGSISDLDIKVSLVSDADDVGVIQRRIVQNIYDNDIIICDVSAKNPNVMFELGMRLAFDKPTIIIKDDKTGYSFDTNIIEHLEYPRDLRFTKIVTFKKALAEKVLATYKSYKSDPDYTTFLKHFATIKPKKLDEKEGSSQQVIMELLGDFRRDIVRDINRLNEREAVINRRSIPNNLEAIIRTTLRLKEFIDNNPISIADLDYRIAMDICDAHRYIRSPNEFREIFEVLKYSLMQEKDRV